MSWIIKLSLHVCDFNGMASIRNKFTYGIMNLVMMLKIHCVFYISNDFSEQLWSQTVLFLFFDARPKIHAKKIFSDVASGSSTQMWKTVAKTLLNTNTADMNMTYK